MKKFTSVIGTLGFVLSLAACGGAEGKLKEWKDKACACKDAKCAEALGKELAGFEKDFGKEPSEKIQKIAMEGMTCLSKAVGAGLPTK